MRIIAIFLVLLIAIALSRHYFQNTLSRTIVVDAETGALEIELEAELSGKAFRNVWFCEQRGGRATAAASPVEPIGCPSRTHHLVGPEPVATPILPAGANLKITTSPNALRIDVTSLPARYRGSDIGRLEGGAVIVAGQHALEAFGTMPLSGKAEIGALFSDTDNVSVASGSYQIRGYTPAGLWENEVRELRGGALLTGARVRFVDMDKETATGHVAVMLPDPKTALMRVTAISEHTNSNLGVRYYFTDEVIIGPSFLEALLLDPLVQLLAMALGAFAGYGWLNRLLTSADRNSTQ